MPLTGKSVMVEAAIIDGGKIMDAAGIDGGRNHWRLVGWGGAALLLLLPFVAMQFTREVNWTASDFIFMGILLAALGGLFELAVRLSRDWTYRAAFALALLASFLLIWVNLAVGIVGSEDNPANIWFFGALLVAVAGGCLSRGKPAGMAHAMFATAMAIIVALVVAEAGPTDEPFVPAALEVAGTGLFVLLFAASGALFRTAAHRP